MRIDLKLKRLGITIFLLLVVIGELFPQSQVIDLWHGKVPGAITNTGYQQTVNSEDNWTKMRFITDPSLDMYPAPADKANGTAVIICPGGGYWGLAITHEGADVAEWLTSLGITAFVLKYRLPDDAIMKDKSIGPLQDGQEAIRTVRRNAKKWNIDPNKIGIMGFSAGGHLASTLSTHFDEMVYEPIDTTSARPDFSLLIYPVISMDKDITHGGSRYNLLGENPSPDQVNRFSNELQVSNETPPAFLIHSMDDGAVPVRNSINYAMAMQKHNRPSELHLYQSGGHGYGLGRSENTESSWPEACSKWLKARGFLKEK
ncbi:MAG: alpha/beta hydrolase [Cyclobacteriaceae bacterium]